MIDWQEIRRQINAASGGSVPPGEPLSIGGGCINRTFRIGDETNASFIKINAASRLSMFEAEAAGLQALARSGSIRVPRPVCWGTAGSHAFLALEHISLGGHGDPALAGRQLAMLHRTTADRFGWERDNTIGSTHQPNSWHREWVDFWRTERLGHQLRLCAPRQQGAALLRRGEQLLERFPALIDHQPTPALIHGDLWGGNLGWDSAGNPVIYDPAVYYADREAELAMTELFGGFGQRFYSAYNEAWPLDPGYSTRRTLYNLYHILNHYHMFGGGYGGQALRMMEQLLADL